MTLHWSNVPQNKIWMSVIPVLAARLPLCHCYACIASPCQSCAFLHADHFWQNCFFVENIKWNEKKSACIAHTRAKTAPLITDNAFILMHAHMRAVDECHAALHLINVICSEESRLNHNTHHEVHLVWLYNDCIRRHREKHLPCGMQEQENYNFFSCAGSRARQSTSTDTHFSPLGDGISRVLSGFRC